MKQLMSPATKHKKASRRHCPYLPGAWVSDLLVQADVQIISRFISEKQTNRNGISCWCQADVDLQLRLQDPQLPQTAAIAHYHGANRFLYLIITEKRTKMLNRTLSVQSNIFFLKIFYITV